MELRERIINEAGVLFARYGIRSITMDALAEEMGVSKRTIYEQFKDKDTLLLEVITYFKTRQLEAANTMITESENIVVALFGLVNEMINNMKQISPLFFQDMKKYHSHIFKQLEGKGELRDHSMTRIILSLGLEQGIFREDYNIEIVNLTLHELFNFFSPESRLTQIGYNRGELFNNIIIPYLIGISTEKGKALIEAQGTFKY